MRREFEKTIEELQFIDNILGEIGDVRQAKLAYMIAKNKSVIKTSLDAFREALKPSTEAVSFEKSREKLLSEYAKKDKSGNSIKIPVKGITGVWQFVLEDEEKYKKEFDKLKVNHEQGVKDIEELEERRKQLLTELEEISLYCIDINDLKEDENGNIPISAIHLSQLISFGIVDDESDADVIPIKDKKNKKVKKEVK